MQLSPSGDKVAFLATEGDTSKLVVEQIDGKVLVDAAAGSEKLRSIRWLGEDHVLLEMSKTLYNLNFVQLKAEMGASIVVSLKTRKAMLVFAGHPRILPATFGYYGHSAAGGQTFGYFGGLTLGGSGSGAADFDNHRYHVDHGYTDLYKVDLDTGEAEILAHGAPRLLIDWLVDPGGGGGGRRPRRL